MTATDEARSRNMRAIKAKNTGPEMKVRRLLHGLGYRYRLHRRDLPGKPDIVFPSRRKIILINGCFWHGHDCPAGRKIPKTNADYWGPKIERNRVRDSANCAALEKLGWAVCIVWECGMRDKAELAAYLTEFLGPPGKVVE